jgi:hypothetical protein
VSGPVRRTERRRHLDASAVPVEQALLHRAEALETGQAYGMSELTDGTAVWDADAPRQPAELAARWLAGEFRTLAEELHYW